MRTSLDPVLQAAADKALRDGPDELRPGTWRLARPGRPSGRRRRGAEARLASALAEVPRPPGMLPDWRLAVVLEATDGEAKLGLLDRAAGAAPRPRRASADAVGSQPGRVRCMTATSGPRRAAWPTSLQVGDVVMVEPTGGAPRPRRRRPASLRPDRAGRERLHAAADPAGPGRAGGARPAHRPRARADRRLELRDEPVQPRHPGAAAAGLSFKPFVYLTAMEQGISPSQRLLDAPFVLDHRAAGQVAAEQLRAELRRPDRRCSVALEKSLNLVTVRRRADRSAWTRSRRPRSPSTWSTTCRACCRPRSAPSIPRCCARPAPMPALDVGGKEVHADADRQRAGPRRPRDLARRRASPARAATTRASRRCCSITRKQIADAASAFQVVTMMEGVVQRGTGTPAGKGLEPADRRQDRHDAGFQRRLVRRLHARPRDRRVGRLRQSDARSATTRRRRCSPRRSGTISWRSR